MIPHRLLPFIAVGLASKPCSSPEPIAAFPGAEGAGKFTIGGRGGEVVRVTNLKPDGPGSLAEAVSQPHRMVVFEVSGIIDLTSEKGKGGKIVVQPHITIAGQTAPGEGICLKGGMLKVESGDVIIRYLRSRRGFVHDQDTGDAIEVKPVDVGAAQDALGRSQEIFDKVAAKKAARGKVLTQPGQAADIMLDHLSASWATDENLTMTHTNRSTAQFCIVAEGLDYANAKQTPPNHSEGSLWGSSAPNGQSTMHHMLYAHNRLRNPRTTGGAAEPPVLTFYNSVVYDWSEYASHTGSEIVHLNWLNNFYKPGPSTPEEIRTQMFGFHVDPGARIYTAGNFIAGSPEATKDNRLTIAYAQKLRKLTAEEKAAMIVSQPFGELPASLQTAEAAYEAVLAEAGATLPARDAVDLRIVNSVRAGTGGVIEKETALPEEERWPDYRALPAPQDADGDGLPDFWEKQFGLNPNDPKDGSAISSGGYANIEHYFNNTDPTGAGRAVVFVAAGVSRALAGRGQAGEWRVTRTGDITSPLTVAYTLSGEARSGEDFAPVPGTVAIPGGQRTAVITVSPLPGAHDDRTVVITLAPGQPGYFVGCPSQSLVVIRK